MNRVYLYLARRDKKGCKIIMILQGLETYPTRLTDVNSLRLPSDVVMELQNIIYDNRMDWEPWIESANSYEELRQKLANRGYSQIPLKANPLHAESSSPHVADLRSTGNRKTMVRKTT